jgi:hypothetical protein
LPKAYSAPALTWINATLSEDIAAEIAVLTDANSPILSPRIPPSVRTDPVKFPSAQLLAQSEFISNLDPAQTRERQEIWQNLRRGLYTS